MTSEPAPRYIPLRQAPPAGLTLAAPVVIQQDVARGAGAEVRAGLVHTLVLAEELGEAALVHVWGRGDQLHLLFTITDSLEVGAQWPSTPTATLLDTGQLYC